MKVSSPQYRFPRWLLLALVVAVVGVITGGVWFYRDQEQRMRQASEKQLVTIAQLKVDQVVRWRADRLANAGEIMESPPFIETAAAWKTTPTPEVEAKLRERMQSLQKYYHYDDILLVDSAGGVWLSLTGTQGRLEDEPLAALAAAMRQRQPTLTDLYLPAEDSAPRLDVIAPLFSSPNETQPAIGALVLRVNPDQFLYPLIQSWPVPSRTAETLLVRRAGNQVLFLNELRHQQNTALKLKIPLSRSNVPAVMAVLGQTGVVDGRDYRGVEVLSALQAVPDSAWFMVAKVDTAEALSSWRFQSGLILALIFVLVAVAVAAAGMVWQQGRQAYYQALYQAQVERQRAAESLRESEARYRLLFENMTNGLALHEILLDDAGRPCNYRFLEVNPAFEQLTGLKAGDLVGRTGLEALPGVEFYRLETYGRVALTGQAERIENFNAATGKCYDVLAYSPQQGRFAVIVTDITARKQAEAARETLFKALQEKTEEMESLLYISSHDLRSPLVNIQGFSQRLEKAAATLTGLFESDAAAEALRQTALPIVRERIPTALRYIVASTAKMDTLINGLLRLSRLNRADFTPAQLDLRPLLKSVLVTLEHQLEQAQVEIRLDDPLPTCWGDAAQISQVFTNLIDNALKYRDASRPLCVQIHGETQGDLAVYTVEDNGIGIKADHQSQVWGLFARLDPRGATAGEGLGLTVVKRIAQRHGGRVWLESTPGQGSRFFVALPRHASASAVTPL